MTPEEETLEKIKYVLSFGNDAQAIRLIEQYGHWKQKQAEQCAINGVVKSLPTKEIISYLERSEDFYIDDSEIANRFYNAALNDVKYFIEKEEEKLK